MKKLLFLIVWLLSTPAAADYVDDNMELYQYTAPPQDIPSPVSSATPASAFLVRATGGTMKTLLTAFEDTPVVFVHAGELELESQQGFLTEEGFDVSNYSFFDAIDLDSQRVGDYAGMLALAGNGEGLLVDPRYDPGRPRDDAFASRWGISLGTCVFRPPFRILRGWIQSDGGDVCVVSARLYTVNPSLSKGQVDVMLRRYLGCRQALALQPLSGEGEGRLDLFFRFSGPGQALLGQYETLQDPGNETILEENLAVLTGALPDLVVRRVPMPDPDWMVFPSYLPFLNTGARLIVPVFPENNAFQEEAMAALGEAYPEHEIFPINVSTLMQTGTPLTAYVSEVPVASVVTDCTPPEILCETTQLTSCPGLCFDACVDGEVGCLTETQRWSCAVQEDGCLATDEEECLSQWVCDEGVCKSPPNPCDAIPSTGRCNGDTLETCAGDQLFTVNCAANGEFCGYEEDGKAACVPMCVSNCSTVGASVCNDGADGVQVCQEQSEGCLVLAETACEDGQNCQDGECVWTGEANPEALDVVATDVPVADSSTSDISAGFQSSDGGCSSAPKASPWGAILLLVLALGLALRRRQLT